MSHSSMQVTIGSALSRAWDQGQHVDLLVGGHWFTGVVSALDGTGVILDGENFERYVIRLDQVGAVRIRNLATGTSVPELDLSA